MLTRKPIIAVVCGGDSSEYVVSMKSAKNVIENIDSSIFEPWIVRMKGKEWLILKNDEPIAKIDPSNFSFLHENKQIVFDFAFIMIHGTPGEDGKLQGYFDLLDIPYSTCGVYASSLTFHKFYCDNFLRSFGIPMARSVYLTKEDKIDTKSIAAYIGLPMFIKPSAGGSSFGVTKVYNEKDIPKAVELAFKESNDCLIEEFIDGMELACGICELDDEVVAFTPTEVIPKGDFFDFDSKYEVGGATEITPARLSPEKLQECKQLTSKLYQLIGCKGIVRVDFILKNDTFYFLEINTIPGMTETSFIPQQLNEMGLNIEEVFTKVIYQQLR